VDEWSGVRTALVIVAWLTVAGGALMAVLWIAFGGERATRPRGRRRRRARDATLLLDAHSGDRPVPALRRIHELQQAVGVVMAQLGVDADEATARIRAHSYRSERPLGDVLGDLLRDQLTLPDDRPPLPRLA
jgi:hypothetical protein